MIRHGSSYCMAEVTVPRPMGISAPTSWGRSELHRLHAKSGAHRGQVSPDVPAIRPMMGTLPRLPQSPHSTSKPFYP
jgi:hypothetical protein